MRESKEVPERRGPGVRPRQSHPERVERFCRLLAAINRAGGESCR